VSVTAAAGFRAAGVTAGLKPSGRPDVALVVNDGPGHAAAGVFTANRCVAHPVMWSREVVKDGQLRAIVLNSGGANCYTGPDGFLTTHRSAELVGSLLGAGAIDVAVCSTGLIGERLEEDALLAGIQRAHASLAADGGSAAAQAILTTDTHAKQAVAHGDGWVVGGMAKGAGMLAPSLATMLVVLTTDAVVDAATCDTALRVATAATFDRLDSDGCMSTNDTVALLASGASGATPAANEFAATLMTLCHDLAMQLLADAEGSSHDIAVVVRGAASEDDAVEVARSVARSNLLKCAVSGEDPNWGRVLAAVGTTKAAFDPLDIDVSFNGIEVCRGGAPGESRHLVQFSGRDVRIGIDLNVGDAEATIWTNDLTAAYVHENSAYAT
jgi:glutamate N-acetyltransferase / amino-acid N-acetyltransferase